MSSNVKHRPQAIHRLNNATYAFSFVAFALVTLLGESRALAQGSCPQNPPETPFAKTHLDSLGATVCRVGPDADVSLPLGYPYTPGGATCQKIYKIAEPDTAFYPGPNDYLGAGFSTTNVDECDIEMFGDTFFDDTGADVEFLLLNSDCSGSDAAPTEDSDSVQIIHGMQGVVPLGSEDKYYLATVMLPPGWNASGSYPIVAFSNYDLNAWMFRSGGEMSAGQGLAQLIAHSGVVGSGAIGVFWNGGGDRATQTASVLAHHQFRHLLSRVEAQYNGDPQQLILYGGSRGGGAAIMLGSNPDLDGLGRGNYNTRFIAASAAMGWFGKRLTDLMLDPTYPVSYRNVAATVGFHDAWRVEDQSPLIGSDWEYPAPGTCEGHPDLVGLNPYEATVSTLAGRVLQSGLELRCVDGDADPSQCTGVHSTPLSAGSSDFLDGIIEQQTEVFLEIGTHDKLPYRLKMEYARDLQQAWDDAAGGDGENMVEVEVQLGVGHGTRTEVPLEPGLPPAMDNVQRYRVWKALEPLVTGGDPNASVLSADKLRVYAPTCDAAAGDFDWTDSFRPSEFDGEFVFPFTMEAPVRIAGGQDFTIIFAGHPGTEYRLDIVDDETDASVLSSPITGTLPAPNPIPKFPFTAETIRLNSTGTRFDPPLGGFPDRLRYDLRIKLPNEDPARQVTVTPSANATDPFLAFVDQLPADVEVSGSDYYTALNGLIPRCVTMGQQTNWGILEEPNDRPESL